MKPSKHPLLHVAFSLLAAAFTLTAAFPATPSACPGKVPAFSWDHVPRYVHIRKDTAFTPAEIRYLATFPLITFEKYTGNRDSGSPEAGTLAAARAVKAINPATKVLYYRNVIVHYGGYAADAALTNMPGAFLVGRNGSDKLVRNRVKAYDLTNAKLRDWWVASAKRVCADPAIDGLFFDGNVKVLEPAYLRNEIGEKKKAAVVDGYTAMMKDARQMLGPEKLMLANVLRARFPDSGLGHMKAFDGSYIEAFETTVDKIPVKDYVAKGIAAFQKAARQGAVIAFTAGLGEEGGEEGDEEGGANEARTDEIRTALKKDAASDRRFQYLLALFLICAEKHSYFCGHDGYDAKRSKVWMTQPPEFDRPLGAPRGPAVRAGYLYTREFAHASVRLDIEKQTGEVVWH
jgi:hypothetical protein